MNTPPASPDEALLELLENSAPASPLAESAPSAALRNLARAARLEPTREPKRSRAPRFVAAGVGFALILGGAGVATAATSDQGLPWWAPQADASFELTLPDGETCEYLVGELVNADDAIVVEARAILADASAPSPAEVDEQFIKVHGETYAESPASIRDDRYSLLAFTAVTSEVTRELERRGYDSSELPEMSGAITCSGVAE